MSELVFALARKRVVAHLADSIFPVATFFGLFGYFGLLSNPLASRFSLGAAITFFLAGLVNAIILPAIYGQTFGCWLMKIKIFNADRVRSQGIGISPAFVRAITKSGVSWFLGLGYLWYFLDPKRRAWHDYFAATVVLAEGSELAAPQLAPNLTRGIGGVLIAGLGLLAKLPLYVLVFAQLIFLAMPGYFVSPLSVSHSKKLPLDFPKEIVLPDEESIADVKVIDLGTNAKRALVSWTDLPGEPNSVLVAFKAGWEILGFRTEVSKEGEMLVMDFEKTSGAELRGQVRVTPTEDGKATKSLVVDTRYETSAPALASPTSTRE